MFELQELRKKIENYMVIFLMHLIKQEAEQTTTSWNRSIANSVKGINKTNKRRKSGGYYVKLEAIATMFAATFDDAAYEAFEGKLSIEELAANVRCLNICTVSKIATRLNL